jgi:arylsulfatase A-like enzyme
MAEMLQAAGYYTVGWSTSPWVNRRTGLHRGFDEFKQISSIFDTENPKHWQLLVDRVLIKIREKANDKGGELLIKMAKKHFPRLVNNHQPFYTFMFILETHLPYRARNKTARKMLPTDVSVSEALNINWRPNDFYAGKSNLTARDFDILSHLYDADIIDTDERIGRVIKALEKTGVLDDTILIITADHGENIGHHGLLGHSHCLNDDLVRVPLIIRYPSLFSPRTRVEDQVQIHDLVTTLTTIAGVAPVLREKMSHQYSLLPEDLRQKPRRWTFSQRIRSPVENFYKIQKENPDFDPTRFLRDLYSIRGDGWKYILASDGYEELFNLVDDPAENHNVIESNSQKAQDLRILLEKELPIPNAMKDGGLPELDEETFERLRSLGYLD